MSVYDVIIVGAGICGLTAALDLAEAGKKILILEAESRMGGRAKSVTLENGVKFNIGANWFHGGDDNPFYQWAKARYDLGPLNKDQSEKTRVVIANGVDHTVQFKKNLETFEKAYEDFRKESDADISMGALAERIGSKEIQDLAEYWATLWMAGNDAHAVSAGDFFDDPLGVGGWQMQNGISYLIDQMVDDALDRDVQIVVDAPVASINRETGGVRITLGNGDSFAARQVLVTVSVGVLHSGMIAFDDGVNRMLNEKLADVYMGNLFKACVVLDDKFFAERDIPENFPVAIVDHDPCFIHARTAGKPTITVFTGGLKGRAMELWEDDEVREYVYGAIDRSKCFEGFREHIAGEIFPTLWAAHLHYFGSYALHKPGHDKTMDLIDCGSVLFAGEGLLSDPKDSPGQMAGAWLAGKKAAALLLG